MRELFKELHQDYLDAKEAFKDDPKKNIPNILTILRILSGPIVLITSLTISLPVALLIAIIGALTDLFDGILSRKWNAKSEFGRKLDTLADKELALVLISLNIVNNIYFVATLLLEAYIAHVNMKAVLDNKKASTSQIGRIKTFSLYITLLLGLLSQFIPVINSIVMISLGATTVLQLDAIVNYVITYKHYKDEHINNLVNLQITKEDTKVIDKKLSENMVKKQELLQLKEMLLTVKEQQIEQEELEEQKTLKKRY